MEILKIIKKGDKGRTVKEIQSLLKQSGFYFTSIDGDFGKITEDAVKRFQKSKGLTVDGIVGNNTYNILLSKVDTDRQGYSADIPDTDNKLKRLGKYTTSNGLVIDRCYLDTDEYVRDYGVVKPKNLFIHHTAGWDNPYNVVNSWNVDKRGRVATQFTIGGLNIKGDTKYDGVVVEAFPDGYIGWHLGKIGSLKPSIYSVGIELCNFGYVKLEDGKYYSYIGREVPKDQVVDLGFEFQGHRYWHKYSDAQIEALRKLILHIKEIHPTIDLKRGLLERLGSMEPKDAFGFDKEAYNGSKYGLWTHTNVRKDKFDCYPDERLIKMLVGLQ